MAHGYLTVADVLGMHAVLLQRYGGATGVRDPGALEAALFRPQTGYYKDIVAEAAALLESLAINHPFVDGNKRIAFAAADVFLRINGWQLKRAPMQIYAQMMQMFDSGTFDIAHLDPWLRSFAVPAEQVFAARLQ
jgi:death on curing protein